MSLYLTLNWFRPPRTPRRLRRSRPIVHRSPPPGSKHDWSMDRRGGFGKGRDTFSSGQLILEIAQYCRGPVSKRLEPRKAGRNHIQKGRVLQQRPVDPEAPEE